MSLEQGLAFARVMLEASAGWALEDESAPSGSALARLALDELRRSNLVGTTPDGEVVVPFNVAVEGTYLLVAAASMAMPLPEGQPDPEDAEFRELMRRLITEMHYGLDQIEERGGP